MKASRRELFLFVLCSANMGLALPVMAQPTLHYSWVVISGDTVLAPGESVVLGLQAEFTNATGYAGGGFTISMDNFAEGDDSVWIAGTRGVDNLSNNGDQHREMFNDGVGRVPVFRNNPSNGSERYTLLNNQILGGINPSRIELFQFGLFANREPDRSNPITFFTMEFFAGNTLGNRIFTMNSYIGLVLTGSLDIPLTVDIVTTDPITLSIVPAPASLTMLGFSSFMFSRRRRSVL